jgi:hypothetical protein
MTNFVEPDRTFGTVTGDLQGAIGVKLLGVEAGPDGTTVLRVQHFWVTEAGDTVNVDVAEATASQISPGLFAVLRYPFSITGGTGRFAGAHGPLQAIGEVDLNTGRTVFRYYGTVCFKAPAR